MDVVFAVDTGAELRSYLEDRVDPGVRLRFPADLSREAVLRAAADAAVVVGVAHLDDIVRTAPVRLVQVPWAGVEGQVTILRDHPDILLTNSHANAYATAQYGISLLLALANQLVAAHALMQEGRWAERGELTAPELIRGKTIGVLGAGHIGREIARMLQPFEVRLLGMKRRPEPPSDPFDAIYGSNDLDEVLQESDVAVVALPGTEATWHLIGQRQLRLLGGEGYLISIGRGEVVDEGALYHALRDSVIAGAAVDVWYDYHPPQDERGRTFPYRHPFHELDNIIMSPHRAGNAKPSVKDWDVVIENLNRFAHGRRDLLNIVDIQDGY